MSGLTLTINNMENAAFATGGRDEVTRILREVADGVAQGRDDGVIRDVNGDKVGSWEMNLPESQGDVERQRG